MKRAAFFDLDNTLYEGFSYFDVLGAHVAEGLISPDTGEKAQQILTDYKQGRAEYEKAMAQLLITYAQALKGVQQERVAQSTARFFEQNPGKMYDFARPVVRRLGETRETILVTGEPQFIAEAACAVLGMQGWVSTQYGVSEGKFTGEVLSPLAYADQKEAAIRQQVGDFNPQGSFAFGDSEGDSQMLNMVEHGIYLNPTDNLASTAMAQKWHLTDPANAEELVARMLAMEGTV